MIMIPIALQSTLILWDELYFHRKRGLNRWERLGHPLDTLVMLITLLWLVLNEPNDSNFYLAIVLAAMSSLIITKDEWIHKAECSALEAWIHSLLFVVHPVVLGILIISWRSQTPDWFWLRWMAVPTAGLMIFQFFYWNVFREKCDQQSNLF